MDIERIWLTRGGTSTAAQTGGALIGVWNASIMHWILGGGIMTNSSNMAYTRGNADNIRYEYIVNQSDFRIYMEYAFSPVNRYLTDRTEFLVGGGAIISKP